MPITPQISNTIANLNGVAFPDTSHGWAEGAIEKEDGSRVGIVVATADGGMHWTQILETTMQLRDIAFPDILHGWVVGGNPPTILATVDGGRTWKPQTSGIEDDHGAILAATAFPDAQHGWVVGAVSNGGVILATSDGGATWRHQAQDAPNFADDFRGVAFPDTQHGWVVGTASPEGGSLILTTSDGGETWERQTIPATNDVGNPYLLFDIAFADLNHGLAVGDNGAILATTDGGLTWTAKPSGTGALLLRAAFPDVNHGWAVGQADDGTGVILVTDDGGDTWTLDTPKSTAEPLWGVAFPDIRHGWLVGVSGTILRSLEVPLGSVRLTPANARPGESVLVEVLRDDGQPVDPADPVMINGVRGARRYLQYTEPGTYNVTALVKVGGTVQSASAQVVVTAAAWPDIQPAAGAAPIAVPAAVRRLPLLSAAPTLDQRAPYYLEIGAADTAEFQANLARTFKKDPVAAGQLAGALSITAYHWSFGDGATASTANGHVDHDFTAALSVDEEHRLFEVTCAIETAGAGRFEVKRTLRVVNAYAYCRNRGVVAPPVVEESHARKVFSAFEATIAVQNPEASALSLTSQRISYEKGDEEVMGAVQPLAAPFVLAPNAVTTLNLSIPFTEAPADAIGIQVVFLGKDSAGRAIHVETHLDVALPDHRSSGLIRNGLAFTRLAAVGFDKVLTVAESTNPTGEVPVWKQGLQPLHVAEPPNKPHVAAQGGEPAPAHADPQGAPAVSSLKFGQTIVSPKATTPVREAFASAVPTSLVAKDFSKTFFELNDKPGIQDILFRDADPAQALQGKLLLDDSTGINLRTLFDAAKQAEMLASAPKVGDPCDPDNLGDSIPDGFTCQISQKNGQDEIITWHRHACYANARKGDILLAPSGPAGIIGGLLHQVSPPQYYGHCGIMTRNYDMITHSTFSQKRLLDPVHANGSIHIPGIVDQQAPTDGFDPDVVKYGWPGTVTQWIKSAVGASMLADLKNMPAPGDPEKEVPASDPDQKTYDDINPFNKYADTSYNGGNWEIVPPLVVKPDPLEETPEVRARLHAIADAARDDTGKSHYRFFCYTDASIGLSQVAPPEAPKWAQNTYPSVCSSFIWGLLNRAGVHMESPNKTAFISDLEARDIAAGAEVGDDGSLDGLYLYRADERGVAAQWLHDALVDLVSQTVKERVKDAAGGLTDELVGLAGDLIKLFSDIGDDVANQMCNTFASDDSSTAAKDSEAWKDMADARAVSPDNTLFWDPPSAGGLYGYAVPAAFMPERVEQAPRYVWKFVPTHGVLTGVLKVDGEPKSRGLVQLNDVLTAYTDNNGRYSLPKVPFGPYRAKAQWDQGDGILIPTPPLSQPFVMTAVQQELDFNLQPNADQYRTVHVTGDMFFMKSYAVGSNPRQSFPFEFNLDLAPEPGRDTTSKLLPQDFHGIYGAAAFKFTLATDGTIAWSVNWAVSQDAKVIEDMANALSSAVETVSLGFISNLFGGEVNGADHRSGALGPDAQPPAHDSIRIGPDDGTNGLLNFTIENRKS